MWSNFGLSFAEHYKVELIGILPERTKIENWLINKRPYLFIYFCKEGEAVLLFVLCVCVFLFGLVFFVLQILSF